MKRVLPATPCCAGHERKSICPLGYRPVSADLQTLLLPPRRTSGTLLLLHIRSWDSTADEHDRYPWGAAA